MKKNQGGFPKFEHTYVDALNSDYYHLNLPAQFPSPSFFIVNKDLPQDFDLDPEVLFESQMAEYFCGSKKFRTSKPFSMAYAGHQYGHFVILGDGRAHVLGELLDKKRKRHDWQLKGSGQSAYSRRGDGRAALGPMLREYIVSEFMHNIGVPTTRSLAVCTTGETIVREANVPGAVLTRVAQSHIRVGTFQYSASLNNHGMHKQFCDYVIARHYYECFDSLSCYTDFFKLVCKKQAELIADWMSLGFVHGVMNTDNMSIAGETIDYGPCAFLDEYIPSISFSSIDHHGRYSYKNQPAIGGWNLARLVETLLFTFDPNEELAIKMAQELLEFYRSSFEEAYQKKFCKKLGFNAVVPARVQLFEELLIIMEELQADFTYTFFALSEKRPAQESLENSPKFVEWKARWLKELSPDEQACLSAQSCRNPWLIPRNYWLEDVLSTANIGEKSGVTEFVEILKQPYIFPSVNSKFSTIPPKFSSPYATFCGT